MQRMIAKENGIVQEGKRLSIGFAIALYVLLLIGVLFALESNSLASNLCWLLVLCGVLARDCAIKPVENAWQHMIISGGILIIWLTQMFMPAKYAADSFSQVIKYIGAAIWCIHFTYMLLLVISEGKRHWRKSVLVQNAVPILISTIYVACNVPTFTWWFKSDGYTYFNSVAEGVGKWDFTLNTLDAFTMGGHISYGYAPFLQVGLFLAEPYGIGIRTVNLIFAVITIFAFHYILLALFPQYCKSQERIKLICIESIFALCPLFLGIAYEVYTDYAMFFYFVWMVACFLYRWDALGATSAVLLCFSKEFGIFILAGFLAAYGLATIMQKPKQIKNILLEAKRCIGYCVGVVPFLLLLLCGDAGWGESAKQTLSNSQNMEGRIPSTLVIDPDYIIAKLKEIFILHYSWLFWAIFLVMLFCSFLWFRRKKVKMQGPNVAAIVGSCIVFTALQLFYFTYIHFRYLQLYTFFCALLMAWVAAKVSLQTACTLLSPLAILLFVESFVTTDIVSMRVFNTINVGYGDNISTIKYVYIDQNHHDDKDDGTFFTAEETSDVWDHVLLDGMMNNREQAQIETLTEDALKKVSYTKQDAVILSPIYGGLSEFSLWGREDLDSYYWNEQSGNVTMDNQDQKINLLQQAQVEFQGKQLLDGYANVYYFLYPFVNNQYQSDTKQQIDSFLKDNGFQLVENMRQGKWGLLVYRLDR